MDDLCAPWPIDPDCSFGIPADPEERTPEQINSIAVASEILWRFTGGRFGTCPVTVRPCKSGEAQCDMPDNLLQAWMEWNWLNTACGCGVTSNSCGCTETRYVKLPGPVASVTDVKIDGTPVPSNEYEIQNGVRLVRRNGAQWPLCQDMTKPDTEPGTWSVTYERGRAVPRGGQRAVAEFAAELAKACAGKKCRLPERVQSIAREGITVGFVDNSGYLELGRTGLIVPDWWINSVNPKGLRSAPRVLSVDVPSPVQTTWTA